MDEVIIKIENNENKQIDRGREIEKPNNAHDLNIENDSDKNKNTDNKKKRKKQGFYLYKIPEKKLKQNEIKDPEEYKDKQVKTKIKTKEEKYETIQTNISTIKSSSISQINNKESDYTGESNENKSICNTQLLYSNYQQQPIFISNNYYYSYSNNPMQQYASSNNLFYPLLSYEITSFSSLVDRNISLLEDYKNSKRNKLRNIIYSALSPKYDIEIISFGSYITRLAIENSDIDIVIKYKTKSKDQNDFKTNDTIINQLITALNSNNGSFEYINPIYTANVPIIKLRSDISLEVNEKIKKTLINGYLFNIEELFKVKFDLTFLEICDFADKCPSQEIVEYVNNALKKYPNIRPIMFALKRFLQSRNLNSAYKGKMLMLYLFYNY